MPRQCNLLWPWPWPWLPSLGWTTVLSCLFLCVGVFGRLTRPALMRYILQPAAVVPYRGIFYCLEQGNALFCFLFCFLPRQKKKSIDEAVVQLTLVVDTSWGYQRIPLAKITFFFFIVRPAQKLSFTTRRSSINSCTYLMCWVCTSCEYLHYVFHDIFVSMMLLWEPWFSFFFVFSSTNMHGSIRKPRPPYRSSKLTI